MRIRKRFPPSSLSSVPFSDPQLNRSPLVQQHRLQEGKTDSQPSDPPNQPLSQPSDQKPMIGSEKARWVSSDATDDEQKEGKNERWSEEEKSNDTRKVIILGGAEAGTGVLPPSGSHQVLFGGWFEGEKGIPLKKRRGSFVRRVSDETILIEKEKKMKAKMKSKTNKKCVEQEEKEFKEDNVENSNGKKGKRGGVIMEGSRCSRVNGRGWRCCQQTLVGYSLCEHHLGKGRLRSITSVRSRAMMTTTTTTTTAFQKDESPSVKVKQRDNTLLDDKDEVEDEDGDDDYDDDEKKPLMVRKKRMKIGMVKARSISSLLGQTSNSVVVADNNKNSS